MDGQSVIRSLSPPVLSQVLPSSGDQHRPMRRDQQQGRGEGKCLEEEKDVERWLAGKKEG